MLLWLFLFALEPQGLLQLQLLLSPLELQRRLLLPHPELLLLHPLLLFALPLPLPLLLLPLPLLLRVQLLPQRLMRLLLLPPLLLALLPRQHQLLCRLLPPHAICQYRTSRSRRVGRQRTSPGRAVVGFPTSEPPVDPCSSLASGRRG
eukprot:3941308-Rhodomonas_salina.3